MVISSNCMDVCSRRFGAICCEYIQSLVGFFVSSIGQGWNTVVTVADPGIGGKIAVFFIKYLIKNTEIYIVISNISDTT